MGKYKRHEKKNPFSPFSSLVFKITEKMVKLCNLAFHI